MLEHLELADEIDSATLDRHEQLFESVNNRLPQPALAPARTTGGYCSFWALRRRGTSSIVSRRLFVGSLDGGPPDPIAKAGVEGRGNSP